MTYEDLLRPPLDKAALSVALTGPGSLWREIDVLDESASTNAVVVERARAGEDEGLVVVAEHQTSGRGRLDRVWVTPSRAALTFSFLLSPEGVPVGRWPWLPLLTGIAVSEAVRRVAEVDCELKWPNDVLVGERSTQDAGGAGQGGKVAGILVERVEGTAAQAAVVGIGLNVSSSRAELPVPAATSLALEGAATLDRSVILREILRSFAALYFQWQVERGDPAGGLHDSYVRRCVTLGRVVSVALPTGDHVHGEAIGIDADGHLLVRTATGVEALGAGDVVHVRSG